MLPACAASWNAPTVGSGAKPESPRPATGSRSRLASAPIPGGRDFHPGIQAGSAAAPGARHAIAVLSANKRPPTGLLLNFEVLPPKDSPRYFAGRRRSLLRGPPFPSFVLRVKKSRPDIRSTAEWPDTRRQYNDHAQCPGSFPLTRPSPGRYVRELECEPINMNDSGRSAGWYNSTPWTSTPKHRWSVDGLPSH
jgi:hypothetical protein